jgi:hypothetical protein
MSVILQSSGGGQITIQEPATASNFTQTLPAATGTVALFDGSNNLSVAGNLSFNSGYGSSAVAYGCRAWVTFTSALSISGGGNVSSITNNAAGDFTLNFTTAMPDTNYSISGFVRSDQPTANACHVLTANNGATKTTTQVRLITRFVTSFSEGQFFHPETCVVIFR